MTAMLSSQQVGLRKRNTSSVSGLALMTTQSQTKSVLSEGLKVVRGNFHFHSTPVPQYGPWEVLP